MNEPNAAEATFPTANDAYAPEDMECEVVPAVAAGGEAPQASVDVPEPSVADHGVDAAGNDGGDADPQVIASPLGMVNCSRMPVTLSRAFY